jgi:hypothetical protein
MQKKNGFTKSLLLLNLAIMLVSCTSTSPTAERQSTSPVVSTPSIIPTSTPTLEPTIDPAVIAEATLNEEIYALIQIFDDGQGLVSSYDSAGMPAEDFEKLSEQQKTTFLSEKMIDQAYAVLTYIRIGKMEDAKRLLTAMQDMLKGDMAEYVNNNGGFRSMAWWNIAMQQYYLLHPDPEFIEFMQWLDYKGYWRQPDRYPEEYGRRITGEIPSFWENESNIETLIQTILYLKLDERYGLGNIYGVNVQDYNVEEQRNIINERFNVLADHLKETLFTWDDTGQHFVGGYTLVDTYTNAVIMACILERDYPKQFKIAGVNFEDIFEQIEANYAVSITENDKTFANLYKTANEDGILASFEATLQVANAYLAAADALDYRQAHPELVQAFINEGYGFVLVNEEIASEYRQKAEAILADVTTYTTKNGFSSFPLLEKNNLLYTRFGPFVFRAPAMSTLAQYVQFKKGTFFDPLLPTEPLPSQISEAEPVQTCIPAEDSLDAKYRNYKAYKDFNDPEFAAIRQDLEEKGLQYLIEVISENGKVTYNLLILWDDYRLNNQLTPES